VRHGKQQPHVVLSISGVRRRLVLLLKPTTLDFASMRVSDLPHSLFVRMASQAVATFAAQVQLMPAPAYDASRLLEALEALPEVSAAMAQVRAEILGLEARPSDDDEEDEPVTARQAPRTEAIWRAVLDSEAAALPEVEIAGVVARDIEGRHGKLRIPYRKEGESLDYEADAKVEALQEINGELVRVGEVDIRETTQSILVLDNPRLRMQTDVGDRIKLRSQRDLSSFRRRRLAVERILARESVLPDLIDYFDTTQCPEPLQLSPAPTNAELDVYNSYDGDGRLIFSLNMQQRDAFTKLWSFGPLSLLQGPPGTGKTSFIASFIHYALSHGAQSILLASQSHEAVNNAAERVIDLCHRTDMPLDVVRFGAEGMISEGLRPHHSASVLQAYRDLFRSEMRHRITALNRNLGLPNAFAEDWFDIEFHLGRMLNEIQRLIKKREQAEVGSEAYKALAARIAQRRDRFQSVAGEKFGFRGNAEPAAVIEQLRRQAMSRHAVTSPNAIARLDQVIAMAQEWVDRLGTLRGNFEEFLAKTRSLVCGTCVGCFPGAGCFVEVDLMLYIIPSKNRPELHRGLWTDLKRS